MGTSSSWHRVAISGGTTRSYIGGVDAKAQAQVSRQMDEMVVVDTAAKAGCLVDELMALPIPYRKMYMDFEGINLSRNGSVCIGQLSTPGTACVHLLDFVMLPNVLEIKGSADRSLRNLMEDEAWVKFIFDPRNDVDCLYHTCGGVFPKNVICLQLCDVAKDRMDKKHRPYLNGLKKVLQVHVPADVQLEVGEIKDCGRKLFAPELGGRYSVFEDRPMLPAIAAYCCVDVKYFELLEHRLYTPLSAPFKAWVLRQSAARVNTCRDVKHAPNGRGKCTAPKGP